MKKQFNSFLKIIPHDVITYCACAIIIIGLYVSRAMMSMGMMMLIASAIINKSFLLNLKQLISKPHLVLITGYFFVMSISFFWSKDIAYFNERIQIILPFLILPFSFLSMNRWELKWYEVLMILFIILNLSGIAWSLWQYYQQKDLFDLGYIYSKVIPTPFKNDHIRFSIAMVLSICFCIELFIKHTKTIFRILLGLIAIISIVYIHILSSKTGIIILYAVGFIGITEIIFSTKYKKIGIISLFILLLLPFIMYNFFSSFRNKIAYVQYSIDQMYNDKKEPNISDEGRIISYQYAIDIIRSNPIIGVGLGDVYNEMQKRYKNDFSNEKVKVLLPHNQFLMTGCAVGIAGIIYLLMMLFSVFKVMKKNDFLFKCFFIIILITIMIEPMFETQYGTCLVLFFLLFLMKRSKYNLI